MKTRNALNQAMLMSTVLFCIFAFCSISYAQGGPSFSISWDILPYQNFDKPPSGEENAEIKINRATAQITYPIVFSKGKTVLVNQLTYQHFQAKYRNWTGSNPDIDIFHAVQYTLMLQQVLSEKWSLWSIITPGMASDLHGDISQDDFNLQTAVVLIRKFSNKFSFGFGAAYTTSFGQDAPLPVLAFVWNNGSNLMLKAILPTNIDLWYQAAARVRFGLNVTVEGNEYHGDPDIYGVDDPRMRYSVFRLGAAMMYYLSKQLSLNIQGGYIGLHRFEFYNKDTKIESYDLKPSYFIPANIQYGG